MGGQTRADQVKPAGDLSPATTETAGRLGIAIQGTIRGAVGLYGKLAIPRIQRCNWGELGWPELTGMKLTAAPAFG